MSQNIIDKNNLHISNYVFYQGAISFFKKSSDWLMRTESSDNESRNELVITQPSKH